jgi:hypothetical protein
MGTTSVPAPFTQRMLFILMLPIRHIIDEDQFFAPPGTPDMCILLVIVELRFGTMP